MQLLITLLITAPVTNHNNNAGLTWYQSSITARINRCVNDTCLQVNTEHKHRPPPWGEQFHARQAPDAVEGWWNQPRLINASPRTWWARFIIMPHNDDHFTSILLPALAVLSSLSCNEVTRPLTLWHPLLPYGNTAIKHPVPDQLQLSFVIFDIRALWHPALVTRTCIQTRIIVNGCYWSTYKLVFTITRTRVPRLALVAMWTKPYKYSYILTNASYKG